MAAEQRDMQIPSQLLPLCPQCGALMTTNLRCDDRFVQDEGWHVAQNRYSACIRNHKEARILYLELGVGTPTRKQRKR